MKYLCICLISFAALIACGSGNNSNDLPEREDSAVTGIGKDSIVPQNPAPADTGTLAGTWYLVAILPSDTAAGKIPTITFNPSSKTFTGHTGCNNMRGKYNFSDSTIEIGQEIISTKMACPGYNEEGFLKNLPRANHYRFENGMMVLMADQTELSRWTRQPVKPSTRTT